MNTAIPITATSSGNNVIISAPANTGLVIRRIILQANALATATFKAGSTALSGPMQFSAGGGLSVGDNGDSLWELGNNDFIINLSGFAPSVGGWVVYDTYDM